MICTLGGVAATFGWGITTGVGLTVIVGFGLYLMWRKA
jgi:hypothetical protein